MFIVMFFHLFHLLLTFSLSPSLSLAVNRPCIRKGLSCSLTLLNLIIEADSPLAKPGAKVKNIKV